MGRRHPIMWGWALVLPLMAACGGNKATNVRNGEGLNDESARVATNDGPGGGEQQRREQLESSRAAASAQPGERGNTGSVGTTGAASGDRPATSSGAGDARGFVAAMLADGQSEVALGRLASERATNPQVKAFAQQVADDHAKADEELARIASRLNIKANPPDASHKAEQDRLSKLKGADFDREYIGAMVTSHQAAVDQLKAMSGGDMPSHHESADGGRSAAGGNAAAGTASAGGGSTTADRSNDPNDLSAVHAWAAKVAPTVQRHLERARQLQNGR